MMDALLGQLDASRYGIYLFDYGTPVGFRLALKHPERVSALIVQNGNAYAGGLRTFRDPMKVDWKNDTPQNRSKLSFLVAPATTAFSILLRGLRRVASRYYRMDRRPEAPRSAG